MSRQGIAASPADDRAASFEPPYDTAAGHTVQFYESAAFLCQVLADFARAGLDAGDGVVVIATEPHRRAVQQLLADHGLNVDAATADGRLVLADARETVARLMVDGMPDPDRFKAGFRALLTAATAGGGRGARIYGEMVDVLWREGNQRAAIRLEEMWNAQVKTNPILLLCGYSMDNFIKADHVDEFRRVCDVHTHVWPAESYAHAGDIDAQLREVARLQQRARALEGEVRQRHELEVALRQALEGEQVAHHAKDEFLAMLGHELRNPLGVIVLALDLLRVRIGETMAADVRVMIERQVQLLVGLVDDLLDAARLTHGELELETEPVELSPIVASAIESASALLRSQGHALATDVPAQGLLVDADPQRLAQAVGKVIANAARYTPPGGRIRVDAEGADGRVVLRVQDNGAGIAADLLPRLFQPFVQGERGLDRSEGGLGVGLAVARQLIELHGGTIAARSAGPGQGSEFTISLPAAATAAPRAGQPPAPPLASPGSPRNASAQALKVLVVDDNPAIAQVVAAAVRSFGHEVAVAHDAPAALAALPTFAADVAILDIGLPGADGYELARRIRAQAPAPFLVALTGYGEETHRQRSHDAGFDAHIVKPIDMQTLRDLLARVPRGTFKG